LYPGALLKSEEEDEGSTFISSLSFAAGLKARGGG
jgi:hypothetical protein